MSAREVTASDRPGLGLLGLFVLLCAGWRLDYVALLGVQSLPTLEIGSALLGACWIDCLLGIGMIVGLTICTRWRPSPRLLGWLVVGAAFAWVCVARLVDRCYFFYAGDHVDHLALEHFEGDALGMRLDPRSETYLILASTLCLLGLGLLVLATRRVLAAGLGQFAARSLVPALLLAAGAFCASQVWGTGPPRLQELQGAPEVRIPILLVERLGGQPILPAGRVLLDPVVKNKLRGFGLRIDEKAEFPLVEDKVYRQPLPFERSAKWTAKPNVIVLFFESFSAAMTSVYTQRHPGLTPNLEDLARTACVVEDFFNASTPTVTSLTCCYGSYLPVTNTQTWYLEENNKGQTRLRCLPHILGERGWQTVHVHSLTNEFVRTGKAVSRLGFATVIDGPAIGRAIGEEKANWGYSDHQIFRFVVQQLKRRQLAAPFLLSVATVDSHAPFLPSKEGPRYLDGDNPLLSSLHSADHAFGQFWKWFKTSEYFDNTILIATADHAMFPGKEHAELRPAENLANRYYDRVMLCIHDPCHQLPARLQRISSQLDLTPTLLHLLGINVPNHFEGHSLFGSRARYPGVIGMHEFLFGIVQVLDGEACLTNFRLQDVEGSCGTAVFDPANPVLTRCEYLHFYRWKRALHVANRIWPER